MITHYEGYLNLIAAVVSGQSTTWCRSPCGTSYLRLIPSHDPKDLVMARLRLDGIHIEGSPFLPKCRTCGNTQTTLRKLKEGDHEL